MNTLVTAICEALDRGTGAGVKVGVLDTGVADLPSFGDSVAGHFQVVDENRQLQIRTLQKGEDPLSHGTACADIILRHATEASIWDIRIMESREHNSRFKLAAGIRFGMEQGLDILNISIGAKEDFPRLKELVREAVGRGVWILSAIEAEGPGQGFPAAYPEVISIEHEFFSDPLGLSRGSRADLAAHGVYVEARNARGEVEKYTGSSFAAPLVAGLAARVRQLLPELGPRDFCEAAIEWNNQESTGRA